MLDCLIYELFTIPLANARGSDSLTRGSDSLTRLLFIRSPGIRAVRVNESEPCALASEIVNKPQVKHACRKDTKNHNLSDVFEGASINAYCLDCFERGRYHCLFQKKTREKQSRVLNDQQSGL